MDHSAFAGLSNHVHKSGLFFRFAPPDARDESSSRAVSLSSTRSVHYITHNHTPIQSAAATINTAVYPTISRAFTPVIANNGSAQNGCNMFVN